MIYKYRESFIEGVYEMIPNVFRDERGTITKLFHKESFQELGLHCDWGESLITENFQKNILRGFHFQAPPYAQAKTIFCVSGTIHDWVLDLRIGSPTYGKMDEFDLSYDKRNFIYVPEGMANCYLIKEDNTTIAYNLTSKYTPESSTGIVWNSLLNKLDVEPILSEKDAGMMSWKVFQSPFYYKKNC